MNKLKHFRPNQFSISRSALVKQRYLTTSRQERVVILGSGWAGFRLIRELDKKNYDVSAVSPRNHFVFTPLLASTAVGTLESRCIAEPVRSFSENIDFHQAFCDKIDTENQVVHCVSNIEQQPEKSKFSIEYDKLIISVGAYSNTFGIPGVKEHACFLKEVSDARKIRKRLLDCFEWASQPGLTDKEIRDKLHFVIVGGGPTGVEFSAELHDFISQDLTKLYPKLVGKTRMTLYDVAPTILGAFDSHLSEYASQKFKREGIEIKTERHVNRVDPDHLVVDGEEVPYGVLVWSTGLMQNPLVKSFDSAAKDKSGQKILTDGQLRVIDKETDMPFPNVYALGDCAAIKDKNLPATAQVANQKSGYLVKALNKMAKYRSTGNELSDFQFRNNGMMAYIGTYEALIDMSAVRNWLKMSGRLSWFLWRSAYLSKSVSIRNKMLMPYHWLLTMVLGRDISKF